MADARFMTPRPWLLLAIPMLGCTPAGSSGATQTLYRNSPVDHEMRILFASFDNPDGASFNAPNCNMVASTLNANLNAAVAAERRKRDTSVGFWCEPGGYKKTGGVPRFFLDDFPAKVSGPLSI